MHNFSASTSREFGFVVGGIVLSMSMGTKDNRDYQIDIGWNTAVQMRQVHTLLFIPIDLGKVCTLVKNILLLSTKTQK